MIVNFLLDNIVWTYQQLYHWKIKMYLINNFENLNEKTRNYILSLKLKPNVCVKFVKTKRKNYRILLPRRCESKWQIVVFNSRMYN